MGSIDGYTYNSATGTWLRNPTGGQQQQQQQQRRRRPSHPHPLPPKESELIKETQHASSLSTEHERGSLESSRPSYHDYGGRMGTDGKRRRRVRVLSLDGGGIRGYSTLVILQELMHQIYVQENGGRAPKSPSDLPRPCDYFDLIGGNGTGGLIALMLGRMRMDVESCKNYYVELTRFVFITDKTLLGMPYGKTLFKASRLEEAIKHCVRESTRFDSEKITPHSPPPSDALDRHKPVHRRSDSWRRKRSTSTSTDTSEVRGRTGRPASRNRRIGNAEAPLLDSRQGACKTFITTMLEGSPKGAQPVLLRSYPSAAESVPSYKTTIWQAGRATCATASAFKSITIDQVTFLDEGTGLYNPAFQTLDEVRLHEFPGCDVGAFVSVGTGKRPKSVIGTTAKKEWWEGVAFEGFAEAKRRLLRRVDDCERVHRELVDGFDGGRPRLAKSGVAAEDYYRFNVEVGVGEFGMNEWNRLADVSTGTRRYLSQRETTRFVKECAAKLVAIERGAVDDGTKVKFRPAGHTNISGDGYVAELATTPQSPQLQQQSFSPLQQQGNFSPKTQQGGLPFNPADHPALREQPLEFPPEPPYTHEYTYYPPTPAAPALPEKEIYAAPQSTGYNARPVRQQQHYKPLSPPPPPALPSMVPSPGQKPQKEGKVIIPPKYGDIDGETPNPELRVTSPTTVAGGSDEEEEEEMRRGSGKSRRRHRRRSRSLSRGRGGALEGIGE